MFVCHNCTFLIERILHLCYRPHLFSMTFVYYLFAISVLSNGLQTWSFPAFSHAYVSKLPGSSAEAAVGVRGGWYGRIWRVRLFDQSIFCA